MRKKSKKKSLEPKYSVLYGFMKSDNDITGYLKICQVDSGRYGIYDVVDSQDDASLFLSENIYNDKNFKSPDQIADFMNCEDELTDWKFHATPKLRLPRQ